MLNWNWFRSKMTRLPMPRRKSHMKFNVQNCCVCERERGGGDWKKINSIKRDNMQLNLLLFPRSTQMLLLLLLLSSNPNNDHTGCVLSQGMATNLNKIQLKIIFPRQYSTLYFIHWALSGALSVKMPNNIHIRIEYVAVVHTCMNVYTWNGKQPKLGKRRKKGVANIKNMLFSWWYDRMVCTCEWEEGLWLSKYECVHIYMRTWKSIKCELNK